MIRLILTERDGMMHILEPFFKFALYKDNTQCQVYRHTSMQTHTTCLFSSEISIKLFCRKWSTETKRIHNDKAEPKTVNINVSVKKYFVSITYNDITV